jgi:ribosome-binding protein aMBF1 (putative translation factor)
MSDLQKYKVKRNKKNPAFWKGYDERFETFKLGVLLKQARQSAGLTQEQVARKISTTKSVVSRMENHATDIRLSTLERFASSLGKKLHVALK